MQKLWRFSASKYTKYILFIRSSEFMCHHFMYFWFWKGINDCFYDHFHGLFKTSWVWPGDLNKEMKLRIFLQLFIFSKFIPALYLSNVALLKVSGNLQWINCCGLVYFSKYAIPFFNFTKTEIKQRCILQSFIEIFKAPTYISEICRWCFLYYSR